ncbi:MAG: hypothetical protein ACMXYK_02655 [Candidatus Woesearchaeota archaeon]
MKQVAQNILADVEKGKEFIFHQKGHRIVRNIVELRAEIEGMDVEEFFFHVGENRNHFADWVKDAVKDDTLAKKLRTITDQEETADAITKRIEYAVSIIKTENQKIIQEELSRLKKLEKASTVPSVTKDIQILEKDLKKLSKNIDYEQKLIDDDSETHIKPWNEYNPIPPHARLAEFLFGLATGLILGLILFRAVLGY